MHHAYILSKAQMNKVKDVSQNVTLHHPNSLNKAMDGLFKYIAPDSSGVIMKPSILEHMYIKKKNGMLCENPTFVSIN